MIRLAIVEDDSFLLSTLNLVLQNEEDIDVVGLFSNPEEALLHIPLLSPDIVMMDLDFGPSNMTGIDCITRLKAVDSNILFLILTIFEDHDKVFNALAAGAMGYILKTSSKDKIIEALHELQEGGSPMTYSIARKITLSFTENSSKSTPGSFEKILTTREKEVILLISKGRLEKEVALDLNISYKTVKAHISNIYSKLQVNTRVEALNKYFGR